MKKSVLRKDFLMEIKKTWNRYLSLMLISALGVAFYSGIRAADPDMRLTADKYYDDTNMMDIRILSTLGLTDEDVEAITLVDEVDEVMPAYTGDVLCNTDGGQIVLSLKSLPDSINQIDVSSGRLPENENECLIDSYLLETTEYEIGDTLYIEDAEGDTVNRQEYEIVGVGNSSMYMSFDRGTSSIGDGLVDGFVIVMPEVFISEVYTEIYIIVEGAADLISYSDEYEDLCEAVVENIEAIADERCEIRYQNVVLDAEAEIADANEQIADAEAELQEAKTKLDDARIELDNGEKEIANAEKELEDGEKELEEQNTLLEEAEQEISEGWGEVSASKNELIASEKKLASSLSQLQEAKAAIDTGTAQLEEAEAEIQAGYAQIEENKVLLENLKLLYQAGQTSEQTSEETAGERKNTQTDESSTGASQEELAAQIAYLEAAISEGEATLSQAAQELEASRQELEAAVSQYNTGKAAYDSGLAQISSGWAQIAEAEAKLQAAESEAADGRTQLEEASQTLLDGRKELEQAKQELLDGRQEFLDGEQEYEDAKNEYEPELEEAKAEIADAEESLAELEVPEWYVLDRQYMQVYAEYEQNADRIGAIGKVFPAIFFLVAALVCLTTMTRMVEEQRIQIGTLKALGYSKYQIAGKYVLYAFSSSLIGSLLGLIIGQKALPAVIINAYRIMYAHLPQALTPLDARYSIQATVLCVCCTTAAVIFACYKELMLVPAALMRPTAPKSGKRVLLERVTFLWKWLNFSNKATIRNLFRYKKRFFMTIFGISGCMGLLLVGFGLKDSIISVGTLQFANVHTYSGSISFAEDLSLEDEDELLDAIDADNEIESYMRFYQNSLTVNAGGSERTGYICVPEYTEELVTYISLQDRVTQKHYELDDSGVIITEKLASLLEVSAGDTIYLSDGDTKSIETAVAAVTENYFYHYIYVSPTLYKDLYGEEVPYNQVDFTVSNSGDSYEEEIRSKYMEMDQVSAVSFVSAIEENIEDMLSSMDIVIYVLVASAAMLAFIVLFNLNNINVSERVRELATLKVLGFYDVEVSAYISRENIWLTLIGAAFGIVMGKILHYYVVLTAEVDMTMFGREISLKSYIYSVSLTFLFSVVINWIMHYKLKKVNMVESMKSVE